MSKSSFFQPDAKPRSVAVIQEIEGQTAAEVVIALRRHSGSYLHADLLFGFLFSVAALAVLVFSPVAFRAEAIPLDLAISFGLGALLCWEIEPLRRLLSGRKRMAENVARGARAAFHDLGVSRTSGRWGVLVYLSLYERRVEVLPDVGLDVSALGAEWNRAVERLEAAVQRQDFQAFLEAMKPLGPMLGKLHARREDDVNELPDEMDA